jgi:hypothetical protein
MLSFLAPLPAIRRGAGGKALSLLPLPTLELSLPGVRQAVHLDNGHIRVAHVLLEARPFRLFQEEVALAALRAYPQSGLDFPPDVLLAELARREGLRPVSFDRGLKTYFPGTLVPGEE